MLVGLAEGPDGTLYITESKQGKVWRIMYSGDRNKFNPSQLVSMENNKTASHIRTPDVIEDNLQKNLSQSEQLYNTFCGSCHQMNGKGALGYFPPLVASETRLGDKNRFIDIVLNGMNGVIEVKGESYNGVMPSFNFLGDEELSQILTYIRQHFGNNASQVSKGDIQSIRLDNL